MTLSAVARDRALPPEVGADAIAKRQTVETPRRGVTAARRLRRTGRFRVADPTAPADQPTVAASPRFSDRYSSIAAAARLPAPAARITVAAPVTMSPPANTPSREV